MVRLIKTLGPGLLYAGAAVGVSHLVQSTRAGAEYGLALVWAIVLANFLKYPFFEFGPRYAIATGQSLLQGYANLGKWAFYSFILITIGTMFTIQAAVTLVCAGIASKVFWINIDSSVYALILLIICGLILSYKKYKLLDTAIKFVILILTLTSIVALVFGLSKFDYENTSIAGSFNWNEKVNVIFLIALMGWMPAPLDISVWQSLWTIEKQKTKELSNYAEQKRDFHIGYWGTAFLALVFLGLGATTMYGSKESLPVGSVAFAEKLIEIYTSNIGRNVYWVIGIAAFTTMFSTVLSVLDAYPRSLTNALGILNSGLRSKEKITYLVLLIITIAFAWIILTFFTNNMKSLIEFATIISFVTAPILAFFNYKVITSKEVGEAFRPTKFEKIICVLGGLYLVFFVGFYLFTMLR